MSKITVRLCCTYSYIPWFAESTALYNILIIIHFPYQRNILSWTCMPEIVAYFVVGYSAVFLLIIMLIEFHYCYLM